jgi:hypothetical protein
MRDDEKQPAPLSAARAPGTSGDAGGGASAVPGASGAATGVVETKEETALRGLEDVRITATFERADATYHKVSQMWPTERFIPMRPVPPADLARVLLGIDFAAEPSRAVLVAVDHESGTARVLSHRMEMAMERLGRLAPTETPLETKERLLREDARSSVNFIGRFLGRLQGEWQGRPVALPDIPEWGEPRGIPALSEVRGSFTMSPEDGAAFTAWADQVLARAAPPPPDVAKLARELEESISPLMGCSPRPRCKGSTKCKACRTFRCGYCRKRRPWCIGAGDAHPTWCDQCWRRRHRFAARRCWKCDPAGSDDAEWASDFPGCSW